MQGLDRYAYVNNSPLVYVDPTGHFTEDAIKDYLRGYCENEKACYESMLEQWQADTEWWNMLSAAQAGDTLFGTVTFSYDAGATQTGVFGVTFTGVGGDVLTGLTYTSGANGGQGFTLFDIQQGRGSVTGHASGSAIDFSLEWIGFYRPQSDGKPDPNGWYLKPGYSVDDLGAPQFSGLAQTAKWTSVGLSSLGCAIYTTPVGGAACGFLAQAFSDAIIDAMDVEATDYHMQVGSVYFNFQVQPDFNNTWYLENMDYVP